MSLKGKIPSQIEALYEYLLDLRPINAKSAMIVYEEKKVYYTHTLDSIVILDELAATISFFKETTIGHYEFVTNNLSSYVGINNSIDVIAVSLCLSNEGNTILLALETEVKIIVCVINIEDLPNITMVAVLPVSTRVTSLEIENFDTQFMVGHNDGKYIDVYATKNSNQSDSSEVNEIFLVETKTITT